MSAKEIPMADHDEAVKESSSIAATSGTKRGPQVEIKVPLNLDDLETFDLRGDGIKTTHVVSN
jgi:hypothetical protein